MSSEPPAKKARTTRSFKDSREFPDVTIELVVGSDVIKRLPSHRILLIHASEFFSQMLTNGMKETDAPSIRLVLADPVDVALFEQLLESIYVREWDEWMPVPPSATDALTMLRLADSYLMDDARDFLLGYLSEASLSVIDADTLLQHSLPKESGARDNAIQTLARLVHINDPSDDDKLYSLSYAGVCGLLSFSNLAQHQLIVCEDDVLGAAYRWHKHSERSVGELHKLILETVRLTWCTRMALVKLLTTSELGPHLCAPIGDAFRWKMWSEGSKIPLTMFRRTHCYDTTHVLTITLPFVDSSHTARFAGIEWIVKREPGHVKVAVGRSANVRVTLCAGEASAHTTFDAGLVKTMPDGGLTSSYSIKLSIDAGEIKHLNDMWAIALAR
jgi:hypothetical protein